MLQNVSIENEILKFTWMLGWEWSVVGDQVVMESAPKRNVWNDFVPPLHLFIRSSQFSLSIPQNCCPNRFSEIQKGEKKRRFNTARSEGAGEAVRRRSSGNDSRFLVKTAGNVEHGSPSTGCCATVHSVWSTVRSVLFCALCAVLCSAVEECTWAVLLCSASITCSTRWKYHLDYCHTFQVFAMCMICIQCCVQYTLILWEYCRAQLVLCSWFCSVHAGSGLLSTLHQPPPPR